jgi:hypothetical protein
MAFTGLSSEGSSRQWFSLSKEESNRMDRIGRIKEKQ